jgi:hypothetical protein
MRKARRPEPRAVCSLRFQTGVASLLQSITHGAFRWRVALLFDICCALKPLRACCCTFCHRGASALRLALPAMDRRPDASGTIDLTAGRSCSNSAGTAVPPRRSPPIPGSSQPGLGSPIAGARQVSARRADILLNICANLFYCRYSSISLSGPRTGLNGGDLS